MTFNRWQRRFVLASLVMLAACADLDRGPTDEQSSSNTPDASPSNDVAVDSGTTGPTVDYTTEVYPLLLHGCRDCHRQGGEAGATTLIFSGNAGADLTMLSALSNLQKPAESRLLIKATGLSHQGGVVFVSNSPSYDLVLQWIAQGTRP